MLGILLGIVLFSLNPIQQLTKAKDTQRQSDIKQLQTALDTYYSDSDCYPVADGDFLTQNELGSKYIKQIPIDPDGREYAYLEDSSLNNCPQWNALFTRLDSLPESKTSCPLLQIEDDIGTCTPQNFDKGYNFCVISGEINCTQISRLSLPDLNIPVSGPIPPSGGNTTNTPTPPSGLTGSPTLTLTPTLTPSPTLSPTPFPTPPPCSGSIYAYDGSHQYCNTNWDSNCNCNSIGLDGNGVPSQCTFAGGSLVCYQNRVGDTCVNPVCTNYQ